MNLEISTKAGFTVIAIAGSIDSNTTRELQKNIMDKISDESQVMLVFSKVDFVSSAGLRLLLMIYRQVKSKNGRVVLVDVKDEIKDVMEMTGFINFFEFADSIEDVTGD